MTNLTPEQRNKIDAIADLRLRAANLESQVTYCRRAAGDLMIELDTQEGAPSRASVARQLGCSAQAYTEMLAWARKRRNTQNLDQDTDD